MKSGRISPAEGEARLISAMTLRPRGWDLVRAAKKSRQGGQSLTRLRSSVIGRVLLAWASSFFLVCNIGLKMSFVAMIFDPLFCRLTPSWRRGLFVLYCFVPRAILRPIMFSFSNEFCYRSLILYGKKRVVVNA